MSKTRLRHDRANPTYGLRAAVGSLIVPPDSGECVEALELIKSLPLEGAVVTGDAAFTFKAVVEAIRERGAVRAALPAHPKGVCDRRRAW